jgi:hypothetical protein
MKKVLLFFLFFSLVVGKSFAQPKTSPDTLFFKPYIDLDEWREKPVKHRYVHGGFKGTETRFSFYFPVKEQYQGRFFQYITPVPDNENLSQGSTGESDKIGFSIASGAYFVETNGGGITDPAAGFGKDALIVAFKANEAAAKYSRIKAAEIYGTHRTYGYCFGGSGGAYRTIGAIENTNTWDGAVPFVVGSPVAIPNVFSVRMHAMRVLKDKFPQIVDALEPGGSGDIYAGLTTEESEALKEVTQMGFPPKAWFAHKYMGIHAFAALYQGMSMADAAYFQDFWKVKGYLGANPTASLLKARIQHSSKIKMIITAEEGSKMGLVPAPTAGEARGSADAAWKSIGGKEGSMPVAFQIENILPDVDFLGGDLIIKTGAATGKKIFLSKISGDKIVVGTTDPKVLASIQIGDEIQVDNSNFLAAQTYHRHQVPGKEYAVWNQFCDADGKPLYPQRPMQLGPLFTRAASGVLPSGKFKGKMILLESLWDSEAFPWQADWYRTKVKENLEENTDNNFRVWFTDHANHADFANPGDPTRLVSYLGVLQQALRDLSAWVEKGVSPPANTSYKIEDGQVIVPAKASERKGIQPTIVLKADGSVSAKAKIGKPVTFTAIIEVPENTGKIVSAEWDFEGTGTFELKEKSIIIDEKTAIAKVKTTYTFKKSGTYFPTLRVASQREGNAKTPFALIQNLDRVRVVVK